MFRTHQPRQTVFRPDLTRHGDLTAASYAGAVYIGLGDQFDDDRRLVRETASRLRLETRARLGWRFPSSCYRR
jgi:hypothetical protein